MQHNGYTLKKAGNTLIVKGVKDFDAVHVFECGQCFRWNKTQNGSYKGVVRNRFVEVSVIDDELHIQNATEQDFIDIWYDYFDLGTDYSEIKKLVQKDDIMKEAVKAGAGIRLLKQDFWEVLISFIISANNGIPRIMKTVEQLSQLMGSEIDPISSAYQFPSIPQIATKTLEEIQQCRAGFRCKYIHETSKIMHENVIDKKLLLQMDTESARNQLMKLPGVGPKVADCILLFSGTKYDVFPTDVWVKRVMEELYLKREASLKEIQAFAKDYFGNLTGYAQQYLFYYARLNKIGTK